MPKKDGNWNTVSPAVRFDDFICPFVIVMEIIF